MNVVCEICKKNCFLIDGEYICEDGHISKFVQEMTESVDYLKISTVIKKKAEENVFKDYDPSYKHLLMFNLLFCCLAETLGLKDEKYFHYFVNYLSGDRTKVYYDLKLDYVMMVILLYFTRREEFQKKGEVLYFYEFVETVKRIDIKDRIKHFKKLLVFEWPCLDSRHTEYNVYCLNKRREILECLTGKGEPINPVERRIYRETGLENPQAEYNKMLFRRNLKASLDWMLKYFMGMAERLGFEVTSEMIFYFEKFVYMREYDRYVSIPEDDICYFFFLCDLHSKINVKPQKKASTSTKSELVDILIGFLRTSRSKFYYEVNTMIFKTGCSGKIKFFDGNIFYQRNLVKKRFYSLEIYIKKLKALLKTKKNLKLKKEYVDNNMI